jgi:hypothetical protein
LGEPVARTVFDEEGDATLRRSGGVVEGVLDFGEAEVNNLRDGVG